MSLDTVPDYPQCFTCLHYDYKAGGLCPAFPRGIPEKIWSNVHDHRLEFPGDGGTRWEPADGKCRNIRDIWQESYKL